jgi:hypothetical protein
MRIARMTSSLSIAGLSALLIITAHTQTITTFDAPNSSRTVPVAINSAGQVAGYYTDLNALQNRGFLRGADDTFTSFAAAFSGSREFPTLVTGLNDEGAVIGYYQDLNVTSGYLRQTDGNIVRCCTPPSSPTSTLLGPIPDPFIDGNIPFAINLVGQITGITGSSGYKSYLRQPDGTGVVFGLSAFATYAYDLNAYSEITGTYLGDTDRAWHGFLREASGQIKAFDVSGSTATRPRAISQKGVIAGDYGDANNISHGFVRKPNGQIHTFDPIGSVRTNVMAINSKEQITGYYATADGVYHGFVRDKNGYVESFDVPGANGGTYPKDINDIGEIVGYYEGADSIPHGFIRSNDKDPRSHFTN